jgi:uncharacterized membrane protein
MNVLLAGESWHEISLYVKAQNVTASSSYTEAGEYLIAALEAAGANVSYQPCHVAYEAFPRSREALEAYDLVLLSDIGAQSLLLTPDVAAGETDANRLRLLAEYVADGGAVGMIGGYMSFAGEHGQAGYGRTALADVLPVEIAHHDDRIERPEGVRPENHGVDGLPEEWPPVLGYNRVTADDAAEVWATVGDDPLVVVGEYGDGSAVAFTTDCAEHWAPREFLEWERLPDLWAAILDRVAG